MEFANAIGVISAINECVNFFQWARSAVSYLCSRWSGSQEQDINDHVLQLQSGLQRLSDTLPAMYNLIDGAEWKCHEDSVAKLLPKLKDAVYDADDLLDEFRWYETRVELEGNASESPLIFFHTVIKESFNKLNYVQERLDHLSSEAEKMGLHEVGQRFDRSVRPVTSSMKLEEKIYGRDNELEQVMGFLNVPKNLKRKRAGSSVNASTNTSPRNQVSNEPRVPNLPVLPIVGIGGVGKTTLVQHICSHKQVKSQFELIIWVCVSDDFDVKRLTKEVIESCPGKMASTDNLDSLQRALSSHVSNKRLLIVLDDMWDDALKENGQCWKRFCAPLKSTRKGSMMLVTTRCPKVAEGVGTVDPIILQGLKYDVFWSFFKLCVFGSKSSNNDHKLECIGRSILPKLKGSPLAAKTLGRMLRMDLQASHWNTILESELWELKQTETDILPALRLSYTYLPFYLKRCFAFCAVYPNGYRFQKEDLAEIWVAEGFVESQGDNSFQQTGCQYFEDLVTRSFFQEVGGHRYVIPDLLHDMAQKVSEHDCFILRDKNDLDKVPQYVRHIYILPNSKVVNANLLSLCKHTKLRTLICKKQLRSKTSCVMDNWCTKLLRIRVISCASTNELPDSIGNLKHLRYLKIFEDCPLSIPSPFCWLYNLQILDVKTCKIECLPHDFSNLSNLRRFISKGFSYSRDFTYLDAADMQVQGTRLIKNLNQIRGRLDIGEVCMLSEDHAAEAELKNKKYLYTLALDWSWRYSQLSPNHHESQIMQHNATKVIQVLQPPISLRSLFLLKYPGVSLPSWFQPQNLPSLTSLEFRSCGLDSISFSMISQNINLNEIPAVLVDNNNDNIGIFLSLTDLTIYRCQSLSSLEQFLLPDCVPAIKKISIEICESLSSVPTEKFENFRHLEHLFVGLCPNLNWQRGLALPSSLQTLELDQCGDFSACVPKCLENLTSLVSLKIVGCQQITSIPASIWRGNLALLEELLIRDFPDLVSIGGAKAVAKIKKVVILECPKLMEADQIMRRTKLTLVSLPAFTPLLSGISERKSLT